MLVLPTPPLPVYRRIRVIAWHPPELRGTGPGALSVILRPLRLVPAPRPVQRCVPSTANGRFRGSGPGRVGLGDWSGPPIHPGASVARDGIGARSRAVRPGSAAGRAHRPGKRPFAVLSAHVGRPAARQPLRTDGGATPRRPAPLPGATPPRADPSWRWPRRTGCCTGRSRSRARRAARRACPARRSGRGP